MENLGLPLEWNGSTDVKDQKVCSSLQASGS
jgi:hypothetical protein